jgi:hypothetical protein
VASIGASSKHSFTAAFSQVLIGKCSKEKKKNKKGKGGGALFNDVTD